MPNSSPSSSGEDPVDTSGGSRHPQGTPISPAFQEGPAPLRVPRSPWHLGGPDSPSSRSPQGSRSPQRVSLPSALQVTPNLSELEKGPDPLRVSRSSLGPRSPPAAPLPLGCPASPSGPAPLRTSRSRSRFPPLSPRPPHGPAAIGPVPTWPRSRPALLPLAGGTEGRDFSANRPMGAGEGLRGGKG